MKQFNTVKAFILFVFIGALVPSVDSQASNSCSQYLNHHSLHFHITQANTKQRTEKAFLISNFKKSLSEEEISKVASQLSTYLKKIDFKDVYFDFYVDQTLGLNMDRQGINEKGVFLRDVLSEELFFRIQEFIEEQVEAANNVTSIFSSKGFNPKVGIVRFFAKDSPGGLWHKDWSTTLTYSFIGPSTEFKDFSVEFGQSVVFNKNVEHAFPTSQRGRLTLLISN